MLAITINNNLKLFINIYITFNTFSTLKQISLFTFNLELYFKCILLTIVKLFFKFILGLTSSISNYQNLMLD
jgi:hypothetical protein